MNATSILLIEDDELDIISFERALAQTETLIELKTAFNGIEALEYLRKHRDQQPQVILLDVNMPRMNGIEFLKELRKDTCFDAIKIFIMTTSNEESDQKQADTLGITGYILKPMNFNDNTKKNSSMDSFMHFQIRKILNSI